MKQVTAVAGTQHDIVELLDGLQRTFVLHRVLVIVLRLSTQRTRGSNEALTANGSKHVVGLQTILCHHIRFHPDAKYVLPRDITSPTPVIRIRRGFTLMSI